MKIIDFNKTVVFLDRSIISLIIGAINTLKLNQLITKPILVKEMRLFIVPDRNGLKA